MYNRFVAVFAALCAASSMVVAVPATHDTFSTSDAALEYRGSDFPDYSQVPLWMILVMLVAALFAGAISGIAGIPALLGSGIASIGSMIFGKQASGSNY